MIHCLIQPVHGNQGFHCTFIYGFNERDKREILWEHLKQVSVTSPWMICGDFNCVMNIDERIGSQVRESEMREMKSCMLQCGLQDIKSFGNFYTWNNKQQGEARVF